MFGKKKSRILFFILGPVPTAAQIEHAEKIGAVFRNAASCGETDTAETCDAVCGAVPPHYLVERKGQKAPVPKVIDIPTQLIDRPAVKTAVINAAKVAQDAAAAAKAKAAAIAAQTPPPVAPVATPEPVTAPSEATPPPVTDETPPPVVDPALAERRAQEDAGAKGATASQLKEALTQLGIKFASNTPKAELLALYLARP